MYSNNTAAFEVVLRKHVTEKQIPKGGDGRLQIELESIAPKDWEAMVIEVATIALQAQMSVVKALPDLSLQLPRGQPGKGTFAFTPPLFCLMQVGLFLFSISRSRSCLGVSLFHRQERSWPPMPS